MPVRDKWCATNEWSVEEDGSRLCKLCHLPPTEDGHDPCIADLPGVSFACCGHGVKRGYVAFSNGQVIRGQFEALRKMNGFEAELIGYDPLRIVGADAGASDLPIAILPAG